MEAKGLFNVARKEFIDHITSKKFILILALFLIISAVAMEQGIGDYNNRLEDYKEQISQIEEEEEGFYPMPKKAFYTVYIPKDALADAIIWCDTCDCDGIRLGDKGEGKSLVKIAAVTSGISR